ncbi:MAG: adenine nucleotide alpha hydrolase [Spirochaeta sp.]|nr:adenine nucleotide alpha hydrolase [Spirochaeta sp.]
MLSPGIEKKLKIFSKRVGRGINRFKMITGGDRILIGVSGGKDSLALSLALAQRKKWVPNRYELAARFIEWREYPLKEEERKNLEIFFASLSIPFEVIAADMFSPVFKKPFNCYICSRNRKRILFESAESLGMNKIALGHHLDDVIETTLMNLFYKGEFSTMMPVQDFFGGKLKIIRPMCEVREREIKSFVRRYPLPLVSNDCPNKDTSQRLVMKGLIKELQRQNKKVGENIYRAPWHVNYEYLPSSLNQD